MENKTRVPENGKITPKSNLKDVLIEALALIPEDYRLVFTLREINNMSRAEAAEVLQISESEADNRLKKAKDSIYGIIENCYDAKTLFEYNDTFCNPMTKRVMDIINKL
jgi:DNA-directed RNA polymerase specialized sigma24 family protein